ncbi:MAG: NADH-quinone oxidoreductase subunit K [Candidatus Omnitrophica bacterium]|jgi:NADH:ubiquinone oxidoreductase subunit K|nr:NADH-quinone oxidoreductase subunit K [Candidatus Omnitrophota bacterium]
MTDPLALFWITCVFVIMLMIAGLYCIFVTYNLIRVLIGLELLIKAVTLLLVVAGYANNHLARSQAFVITLIVMEVIFIAVAAGIVIGLYYHNQSLDVRKLRNLKG